MVHRHSLVGLWCVIETTVEDTVLLILEHTSDVKSMIANARLKVKGFPINSTDVSGFHKVYSSLERQTRAGRTVAEGYQALLGVFGLSISLSQKNIETLAEINEVRNCILHRGGVIDARSAIASPSLTTLVGCQIHIDRKKYQSYYNAIAAFAQALLEAVTSSSYIKVSKSDS